MSSAEHDDDDGGAEVIAFPRAPGQKPGDGLPARRAKPKPRRCRHLHVEVDDEERTLECSSCGEKVDPITWITRRAKEWDTIRAERDAAERRINELERLAGESERKRERARRHRDARAYVTEVGAEHVREPARLGAAVAALLEEHPVVILEGRGGKTVKR